MAETQPGRVFPEVGLHIVRRCGCGVADRAARLCPRMRTTAAAALSVTSPRRFCLPDRRGEEEGGDGGGTAVHRQERKESILRSWHAAKSARVGIEFWTQLCV